MWPEFFHHLTLHFAIVLPMGLAIAGVYALRVEHRALWTLLRWGGWLALLMTCVAVISGLIAGGWSGGDETLQHHRYLGILTFVVVTLASLSGDYGVRRDLSDIQTMSVRLWWVASLCVIGAGHWGGLGEHADVIPF